MMMVTGLLVRDIKNTHSTAIVIISVRKSRSREEEETKRRNTDVNTYTRD